MNKYTILPVDFFERNLDNNDLYIEIFKYYAHSTGQRGINLDGKWLIAKSVDIEEEGFLVPISIFFHSNKGVLRGIDSLIYAFLCYHAYKNKTGYIKPVIAEITKAIKIKKTEVKVSINHLMETTFLIQTEKSGIFLIVELEYPEIYEEAWATVSQALS